LNTAAALQRAPSNQNDSKASYYPDFAPPASVSIDSARFAPEVSTFDPGWIHLEEETV
jgi:hypothetical protein